MSDRDPNAATPRAALSSKARVILTMVAAGHTYEQILSAHHSLTYVDIFAAAAEALGLPPAKVYSLGDIRDRHARAYEKWTTEEDGQLRDLVQAGHTVAQIAGRLQRERGAIRSRISRLGLFELLGAKERARFVRCQEQAGKESGTGDIHNHD